MPKRPARPPYQVFVSHATADKWIARVCCEKIGDVPGATTFRDDRDIDGGAPIPATLREALKQSDEMLVLLTQTSVQRPWVLHEIGVMWGFEKRIVPVFHDVTPDQFPPLVRDVRAYPLNDFDQYLADLRKRVRGGGR